VIEERVDVAGLLSDLYLELEQIDRSILLLERMAFLPTKTVDRRCESPLVTRRKPAKHEHRTIGRHHPMSLS